MKKTAFQLFTTHPSRHGDVMVETTTNDGTTVTIPISVRSILNPADDPAATVLDTPFVTTTRQLKQTTTTTTKSTLHVEFFVQEQHDRAAIETEWNGFVGLFVSQWTILQSFEKKRKRSRDVSLPLGSQQLDPRSFFLTARDGNTQERILAMRGRHSFVLKSREAVQSLFSATSTTFVPSSSLLDLLSAMVEDHAIGDDEVDSFLLELLAHMEVSALTSATRLSLCGLLAAWQCRFRCPLTYLNQLSKLVPVLAVAPPFVQLWKSFLISQHSLLAFEHGAVLESLCCAVRSFLDLSFERDDETLLCVFPLISLLLSLIDETLARSEKKALSCVELLPLARVMSLLSKFKLVGAALSHGELLYIRAAQAVNTLSKFSMLV